MDGIAVLIADVAHLQPLQQHHSVAVVGRRALPVGVTGQRGEQVRVSAGPLIGNVGLLPEDLGLQVLIDRHRRLAAHLVVEVAQVGGTLPVVGQAVELQGDRIRCSEPAANQDQGEQPVLRVGPPIQVGG